ncbi:hypothetical protein GCM10018780_82830 [Streptomyces lanatus]|nr:hypothetical protein GCM10018780_82830 [Streptomyces lanatus]
MQREEGIRVGVGKGAQSQASGVQQGGGQSHAHHPASSRGERNTEYPVPALVLTTKAPPATDDPDVNVTRSHFRRLAHQGFLPNP